MTTTCRGAIALCAMLVAGCDSAPTSASNGSAETVLVAFYEAIVRQDWNAAHELLHADNKAVCPLLEFVPRARAYYQRLGFAPEGARVRSCEEQDDVAVAHVLLVGHRDGRERTFRDAITLRRDSAGWRIVLPSRFGRPH
jgi:hypothetical protein